MMRQTSDQWWTGTEAADIEKFLIDLAADEGTMPIRKFKLAKCGCGSLEFTLLGDADEGCAKRTCTRCKTSRFICDGAEYWDEAEPEALVCFKCDSTKFNVGVGFSLRAKPTSEVRWITVGQRCTACGLLGSFIDWKIDYSPSMQLIDEV